MSDHVVEARLDALGVLLGPQGGDLGVELRARLGYLVQAEGRLRDAYKHHRELRALPVCGSDDLADARGEVDQARSAVVDAVAHMTDVVDRCLDLYQALHSVLKVPF